MSDDYEEDGDVLTDEEEEALIKDTERRIVLSKLMEAINFLSHRLHNGRVKEPAKDRVRVGYAKALCQACTTWAAMQKDLDLDELKRDVDELKKAQDEQRGGRYK